MTATLEQPNVDARTDGEILPHGLQRHHSYIVRFSGGKDSVATWLYLTRELNLPSVVCTFADTGHESVITHEYLDTLERDHGLNLVRVEPIVEDIRGELVIAKVAFRLHIHSLVKTWWSTRENQALNEIQRLAAINGTDDELDECRQLGLLDRGENYWWSHKLNMENLCVLKRRFPSSMVRFCTTHLKLYPMRRWSQNCGMTNMVSVAGVRSEESSSRADRPDFEPHDKVFDMPHWLPIKDWTWQQVFAMHERHGVPPNPLYKRGCGRVGCYPCIFANKTELHQLGKVDRANTFDTLKDMEIRVAMTCGKPVMSFFSNDKTPRRFHSHTDPQSGKTFPDAEDVRRWAMAEEPAQSGQQMLFEDDWTEDVSQCLSQYGLCE